MDNKVIMTIFGVILLMGAFFFFFKSFSSHEGRQKEEMEHRLALERQRQEEERVANEKAALEYEAQRPMREAEAKRRAEEAEAKRIADKKAYEARVAEQKRKAEEVRQARRERELRYTEDPTRTKALEDKAASVLEKQQKNRDKALRDQERALRQELMVQVRSWLENLPQTASNFALSATAPTVLRTSGMPENLRPGTPPEALTGYLSWTSDALLAFAKKMVSDDQLNEQVRVGAESGMPSLVEISDSAFLEKTAMDIASRAKEVSKTVEKVQIERAISRNKMTVCIRNLENVLARKRALEVADGKEKFDLMRQMREEEQKLCAELRDLCSIHWKSLNDVRGLNAQTKMLAQARDLVVAQVKQIAAGGGATPVAAEKQVPKAPSADPPASTPIPTTDKAKVTIYVMKDGSEIRALNAVTMGDQIALKDDKGALHTIQTADVQEIKNEP